MNAHEVDVLFFGRMADVAGRRRLSYGGEATHLFALRDELFADALAQGRVTARDIRMSVNREQTFEDRRIAAGDEIAFFPVFSGG